MPCRGLFQRSNAELRLTAKLFSVKYNHSQNKFGCLKRNGKVYIESNLTAKKMVWIKYSMSSCFGKRTPKPKEVDDLEENDDDAQHVKRCQSYRSVILTLFGRNRRRPATTRRSSLAGSSSICTDGSMKQQPLRVTTRQRSGTTPVSPKTFKKRRSFITSDRLVKTLKRDSGIRRRFESFAANQFASEGVSFIKNVLEWKAESPGDFQEAVRLCEMYVHEGSPLQINISWLARTNIEKRLADHRLLLLNGDTIAVPITLFDEATNEVANMMVEGGVWGNFVWTGGCDHAESGGSSTDEENASPAPLVVT